MIAANAHCKLIEILSFKTFVWEELWTILFHLNVSSFVGTSDKFS